MTNVAEQLREVLKDEWYQMRYDGGSSKDGDFETVEVIEGESRRWSSTDAVITWHLPTDTYYRWYFESGSTEMQEDDYFDDGNPELVEKQSKTITVTEWYGVAP
jgi:hypothetical protein